MSEQRDIEEQLREQAMRRSGGPNMEATHTRMLEWKAADELASLRERAVSAEALARLNQAQLDCVLASGESWKIRAEKAEAQLASARKAAIEECAAICQTVYGLNAGAVAAGKILALLSDDLHQSAPPAPYPTPQGVVGPLGKDQGGADAVGGPDEPNSIPTSARDVSARRAKAFTEAALKTEKGEQ